MKYDILFAFFLGSFSPENSWIKITKTVHKFKKILFKIVCFSYSYVSIYTQYEIWLLTSLAISFCVQMFYFVLCSPIFVVVAISVLFLQLNTCVNVIAIISIILFFSHYHPAQFIPTDGKRRSFQTFFKSFCNIWTCSYWPLIQISYY